MTKEQIQLIWPELQDDDLEQAICNIKKFVTVLAEVIEKNEQCCATDKARVSGDNESRD